MARTVQDSVQRIAERGRETLVIRLREAFAEAAANHADVLRLDDDKLEEMIERAAAQADGLQWRRALAAAATEELGIGLGEALSHPAVAEAQRRVGAPSYEEALAAIANGRAPGAGTTADGHEAGVSSATDGDVDARDADETQADGAAPRDAEAVDAVEAVDADEAGRAVDGTAADGPVEGGQPAEPAEPSEAAQPVEGAEPAEPDPIEASETAQPVEATDTAFAAQTSGEEIEAMDVRIPATHLDGLAQLDGEGEVTLAFSEDGLEVVRGASDARLAHYGWDELHSIHVRPGRRAMLRRRPVHPRIIVGAGGEAARFEVEGVDADWIEERLAPVLARLADSE